MLFKNAYVDKITAFVSDYAVSHNFYQNVLGLSIAWESEDEEAGNRNAGYRVGYNILIIQEMPSNKEKRLGWIIQFTISGAEEARQYLLAKGVTYSEISYQEDFKWMWFEDPDGNRLGIVDPVPAYQKQLSEEYLQRSITVAAFRVS